MRSVRRSDGRGQVLIVTAACMVVLIGIAALAIDLGFSWMLRREEQNAADPAAVAAARFISDPDPVTSVQTFDGTQGWNAACYYARANGFFDSANTSCSSVLDPNGTLMQVNFPPAASAGDFSGQPGMVQVTISARHPAFFGRIFGQSTTTVSTGAVAARQRGNTSTNSLVSLKPTGCDTARVRGNSTISIFNVPGYTGPGGYVQINSDCGSNTADDQCSTSSTGALNINGTAGLSAPQVNVFGGCTGKTSQPVGILNEAAHQIGDPLGGLQFPPWDTSVPGATCGVGAANTTASGSQGCGQGGGRIPWKKSADSACPGLPSGYDCIELDPGVYYGGWDIGTKIRVTLKPGIYVIAGGGISIGATGSLDSLAGVTAPAPILIFSTDNPLYASSCPGAGATKCQGNLDITAGADLKLAGLLGNQPCPPVTTTGGCPYGGMLIWYDGRGSQAMTNAGEVDIAGGANLSISGTIYAPKSYVNLVGNAGLNCGAGATQVAAVQIISWTWDIGGTGDICMPYDPNKLYKLPMQGLVH
jgi:hypothetical protein